MKDFNLRQYLTENKLYTAEESKEEKTVINEGKKGKSNYMTELAEIDKQSALVALEAKINKLAEMAEAKANRLALVNEDENLSELISKQAVKEMHRSIKEIEKLKEKLLKEFTKKGGKMTEVIDEEMDDDTINPTNTEKQDKERKDYLKKDAMPPHMKKEEVEEGYSSTTYEEDNIEEEIEKFDAEADFRDQLKKHKANYDKTKTKPAQVAKEKLPTLYKEDEEIDEASCGTYEEDGIDEDKVKGSNVRRDKSDGDWEVMSGKTGKPWPQDYKTKKSAAAALRGYHASKG